ncbi:MAG: PAS domain S-box protein [Deltaproteobacteria bacterium]|nr:PAS domain S-box protein [Deltaproteobacteria bacterium]
MAKKPTYKELERRIKKLEREAVEKKRAEVGFRESEGKLNAMLQSIGDHMSMMDKELNIVWANETAGKLFGNDVIGKKCYEVYHGRKGPCKPYPCITLRTFQDGKVHKHKTQVTSKDGKVLCFHCTANVALRDENGEPVAVMEISRDITEQKCAEEALRESEQFSSSLMTNSPHPVIVINPDSSLRYMNPAFEKLTGFSSAELVGRNAPYPWWTEETLNKTKKDFKKALDKGAQRLEQLFQKKNGERFRVEITSAPIRSNGKQKYYLANWVDITERKRAEEALLKSRQQLFQAQKMKALGTLVAGVAHEINNPINLIMFNVPLLKKIWRDFQPLLKEHADKEPHTKYGGLAYDFLEGHLNQLLSDMEMAANRVAKIVTDLKGFARESSVTDKIPMEINTAVENTVRLARTTLRTSGVKVRLDLADNLPLIQGNSQSIEQILLNLVINAVQSIDHDQGELKIVTGLQNKDRTVFARVSDNGCGVDPSISDTLFDPFVTHKQDQGGTGLGLSITYNLVKAHDGEITFQSRKGNGTTFTVSLPTT